MESVKTKIESVSVYRNGAEIRRKGTVHLSAGPQTVRIEGLGTSFDPDTVRVYAAAGLGCSDMRIVYPGPDDESEELRALRDKLTLLDKRIETAKLQLELWKTNGDFTSKDGVSAGEVSDYIEKLPGRVMALEEELLAAAKEKKVLAKQIEDLSKGEARPAMSVGIDVPADGAYAFELRYFNYSAYWQPLYEIRSDGKNALDFRYRAKVSQTTGEDWKDVRMSLFTGDPAAGGMLPRLEPVYLDILVPRPAPRVNYAAAAPAMGLMKAAVMEDTMAMEEADAAYEAPVSRMTTASADVRTGETMTEYALPGLKTLTSGGDGLTADLRSDAVPAEYRIAAVPSLDVSAYLTARVKTSDLPVTSPVNAGIYLDDTYTGSLMVDPDPGEDHIDITLGREERIGIRHRELGRKTQNTLLKGLKVVEYTFETTAANRTDAPQKVFIRDRLPVSQNKDITVEALELSGGSLEKETGMIDWTVEIPAGGTKTLTFSYKVSRPKDKEITRSSGGKTCPVCGARVTGSFCPECGTPV